MNKGCGLAIYIKKYLKAKEEVWKFKYFTMQKYISSKKSLQFTKTKVNKLNDEPITKHEPS
jgi:hypothetical protein